MLNIYTLIVLVGVAIIVLISVIRSIHTSADKLNKELLILCESVLTLLYKVLGPIAKHLNLEKIFRWIP